MAGGGERLASEVFGGRAAPPRPATGVLSGSKDERPHLPGGCDQVLTEIVGLPTSPTPPPRAHTHKWEALKGLIKVHGELDRADKATRKSLKKEIDQRRKGLETLKERILYYEAQLGQEPSEGSAAGGDGQICLGAQAEAALAPVADEEALFTGASKTVL